MEGPKLPEGLPLGLFSNTPWIYEEVSQQPIVSTENIKKYWKVYTTTFTRLIDPTAGRLENFWWHIWGSDRRHLPGPVLAQLFKDISEGPTFTKLQSAGNGSRQLQGSLPGTHPDPGAQPNSVGIPTGPAQGEIKPFPASSSASKQMPTKPILKKARGPSASGPRPTARFMSPPSSGGEDDAAKDSEAASSGSTAVNSGPDVKGKVTNGGSTQRAKKSPRKKGAAFVASKASKRRPAMPRRQSSQSSAASDLVSKDGTSEGSRPQSLQPTIPSIAEWRDSEASEVDDSAAPLSEKAAGKRPARYDQEAASVPAAAKDKHPKKQQHEDETCTSPSPAPDSEEPDLTAVNGPQTLEAQRTRAQSTSRPRSSKTKHPAACFTQSLATIPKEVSCSSPQTESSPQTKSDPFTTTKVNTASQPQVSLRFGDTREKPRRDITPSMARSRSDTAEPGRTGPRLSNGRGMPLGLASISTASTTDVNIKGTIIDFDENLPHKEAISNKLREVESGQSRAAAPEPSILESRLRPTEPSPSASVPLGRSKSQLQLLLDKSNEKKPRR